MWMRFIEGVADWVLVRIKGCRLIILIIYQRCKGECIYFKGVFGHFWAQMGAFRAQMCGVAPLYVVEIG